MEPMKKARMAIYIFLWWEKHTGNQGTVVSDQGENGKETSCAECIGVLDGFLRELINQRTSHVHDNIHGLCRHVHTIGSSLQFENGFNDTNFRSSGIQSTKGTPIIDNHAPTQDIRTSINRSRHERYLKERREFFHILYSSTRMDHASLVGKLGVRTHQGLATYRLSKDFHAENITNDFFGFTIRVGMNQSNVIVGTNDIAQGRKAFFNPLYDDLVG
mmetsp:Transcript_23683/g.68472  ORF Transcript_23683/g.68472 Transcript_23683/m.68472 type:complete len:217 (+) Transcript_23683:227-877(+)